MDKRTIDPLKHIAENFKTFAEFRPNMARRTCWQKCYLCKRPFNEQMTKFIHLIQTKSDSLFICDGCLKKTKHEKGDLEKS